MDKTGWFVVTLCIGLLGLQWYHNSTQEKEAAAAAPAAAITAPATPVADSPAPPVTTPAATINCPPRATFITASTARTN